MLEVENLTTEIDSDMGLVRAVDALSLTIERGETFALVGESGCGKSMTACIRRAKASSTSLARLVARMTTPS